MTTNPPIPPTMEERIEAVIEAGNEVAERIRQMPFGSNQDVNRMAAQAVLLADPLVEHLEQQVERLRDEIVMVIPALKAMYPDFIETESYLRLQALADNMDQITEE